MSEPTGTTTELRIVCLADMCKTFDALEAVTPKWRDYARYPVQLDFPGCTTSISGNHDTGEHNTAQHAAFAKEYIQWMYHNQWLPDCKCHVYLNDLESLPKSSGVYFVSGDWPHTCLYVGQSINIQSRWKSHHKLRDIFSQYRDTIDAITVSALVCDIDTAIFIERLAIAALRPSLNSKTSHM